MALFVCHRDTGCLGPNHAPLMTCTTFPSCLCERSRQPSATRTSPSARAYTRICRTRRRQQVSSKVRFARTPSCAVYVASCMASVLCTFYAARLLCVVCQPCATTGTASFRVTPTPSTARACHLPTPSPSVTRLGLRFSTCPPLCARSIPRPRRSNGTASGAARCKSRRYPIRNGRRDSICALTCRATADHMVSGSMRAAGRATRRWTKSPPTSKGSGRRDSGLCARV